LVSSRARKSYATINKSRQIKKIAVVTNSIVIKTIAKFIVEANLTKIDMRLFDNEDEALKWL